jgi:hypothetical protein
MNNHGVHTITFIFNLALTLHTVREKQIFPLAFVVLKLLHITASRRSFEARRMGKKKVFFNFCTKVLLYASAKIINNMQCDNTEKREKRDEGSKTISQDGYSNNNQ